MHQGERKISEALETPCVVTALHLCMQLGHAGEQGAAGAGIETSRWRVPSGIPALGMVGIGLSFPFSSLSLGSAYNMVMLEHSLP